MWQYKHVKSIVWRSNSHPLSFSKANFSSAVDSKINHKVNKYQQKNQNKSQNKKVQSITSFLTDLYEGNMKTKHVSGPSSSASKIFSCMHVCSFNIYTCCQDRHLRLYQFGTILKKHYLCNRYVLHMYRNLQHDNKTRISCISI